MYKFKPFVFIRQGSDSVNRPTARSGHSMVCDHRNLYSYGGFNPNIPLDDPVMRNDEVWIESRPLFRELWKFNFATQQWKRLPGQKTMPDELVSNAMVLLGNVIFSYGGTGVPFGSCCSNRLYACNVKAGKMRILPTEGDIPRPLYGHALLTHGPYLYTVGGTTGYQFFCDIHRLDLRTGVWEAVYICKGESSQEPTGRYKHEIAFDGKMIYVLGGGTAMESFSLSSVPTFDLEKKKWITLNTLADKESNRFPAPRYCHGCVQHTDPKTGVISVVITGGMDGEDCSFDDVWKLELNTLQWTCLKKCILPCPTHFHRSTITPEGCMYTFGGKVKLCNQVERTYQVHSMWLVIPKLSEICWEALNYYNPNLRHKSTKELLLMGIPLRFVERID